jgi:glycerol uptake facilitator-like aquaporin
MQKFIDEIKTDFFRLVVLALVAAIATFLAQSGAFGQTGLDAVSWAAGVFVLVAMLSHVTRRLLVPRFGLQRAVSKACETSQGAAIVSASFLAFYIGVAALFIWLLK